jgi:hypothetical protein
MPYMDGKKGFEPRRRVERLGRRCFGSRREPGPLSIGARIGFSLSLPGCRLFLAFLKAYVPPTQHRSACEVWYAG